MAPYLWSIGPFNFYVFYYYYNSKRNHLPGMQKRLLQIWNLVESCSGWAELHRRLSQPRWGGRIRENEQSPWLTLLLKYCTSSFLYIHCQTLCSYDAWNHLNIKFNIFFLWSCWWVQQLGRFSCYTRQTLNLFTMICQGGHFSSSMLEYVFRQARSFVFVFFWRHFLPTWSPIFDLK